MEDKNVNSNVLMEVYVILTELNLYSKLPKELQEYIFTNKNNEYTFIFNKDVPLFNQISNEGTKVFLSYVYIKYINESSSNKKFMLNEVIDVLKKVENK